MRPRKEREVIAELTSRGRVQQAERGAFLLFSDKAKIETCRPVGQFSKFRGREHTQYMPSAKQDTVYGKESSGAEKSLIRLAVPGVRSVCV